MIKLETIDGKRVTEKTILNSFIVFREDGKNDLLNLEKLDLESGLDDFVNEYLKKDYYILDKNRKYLKDDYLKASNTMTDIFKQVEDRLRKQYEDEFSKYREEVNKIKRLKGDELEKAVEDMNYSLFVFLKSTGKFKTRYIDGEEVRVAYSLKMNEEEIDNYIKQTIESLLVTERDFFVSRTSIKLASILKNRDFEAKGNVTSSATYTIEFKLNDGARFTAKGTIVGVVSCCGKYFHRYPINFSNPWFSDGTFMPNPSHYRLVAKL